MAVHTDLLLGRLALERGWIDEDRLRECLQEQSDSGASRIGTLFVRKGYLRPDQLQALLEEQERRLSGLLLHADPYVEDALLARLLIRQGLVTEPQVDECLRLQAARGGNGSTGARLGEILVERNYLASDQIKTAQILSSRTHLGESTSAIRAALPEEVVANLKDPQRRLCDGKYVLIGEAGRGGTGVVWKAWQSDLQRHVAIKILAGTAWSEADLRRFFREAKLAANLSHANIAAIYEVGSDVSAASTRHFIAMEYVEGESFSDLLSPPSSGPRTATRRRTVGNRRLIEIVREAALAVDFAHAKGIIHRDLKPGNIMVAKQGGRIYVMDFGLARPVRTAEAITVSDAIVGTPAYMSPEQARGGLLGPATDVYSLGAILYAVLTRRPPFEGKAPAETLMRVLGDDPVPPRELNPRVHADVETICLKALAKDPKRRYESARAFSEDLARYLEGEPIIARPSSWPERIWKGARRRPILAASGLAAFLGTLLLALSLGGRSSDRYEEYLQRGDEFLARRRYDQAIAWYDRAAAERVEHASALQRKRLCRELQERRAGDAASRTQWIRRMADELYARRAFGGAQRLYEKLAEEDPVARARFTECRDRIAEEARSHSHAVREAKRLRDEADLRRRHRSEALLHYERGRTTFEAASRMKRRKDYLVADVLSLYYEARNAVSRAIELDRSYSEALFLRGRIQYAMGSYALAERDFQDALRAAPSLAPAAFHSALTQSVLAELYRRAPYIDGRAEIEGLLRRRKEAAEIVLRLSPPVYERWCAQAILHLHAGRFDEAVIAVDKVAVEGSGRPSMHLLTAILHLGNKDSARAREELDLALELEPVSFEARYLRAHLHLSAQRFEAAVEEANGAIEAAPGNFLGYLLRARAQEGARKKSAAIADLEKAAMLGGNRREEIRAALARLQ